MIFIPFEPCPAIRATDGVGCEGERGHFGYHYITIWDISSIELDGEVLSEPYPAFPDEWTDEESVSG